MVAVEPCITFGHRREPLWQVLKRPPAPIAANAVGEGLTIAGRAMEIDCDHGIARPCEHRRVPAIGPAVVARALRPAMQLEPYLRHARNVSRAPHTAPHRQTERTLARQHTLPNVLTAVDALHSQKQNKTS